MSAERHIKRIYLSAEADFAVSDILSMYSGVVPMPLPPFSRLGAPVASHADMLMLPLDGRLYTYGEYLSRDPTAHVPCASHIRLRHGKLAEPRHILIGATVMKALSGAAICRDMPCRSA